MLVLKPRVPEGGVGGVPGVIVEVVWQEAVVAFDLLATGTIAHRDRRDRHPIHGQMPFIGEVDIALGEQRPRLPITSANIRMDVVTVVLAGGRMGDGECRRRGGPPWYMSWW